MTADDGSRFRLQLQNRSQVNGILMSEDFPAKYDEAGSIGRRYARFDEIGTPLCITVDYQTLKDETVTVRDRSSWKQVRTRAEDLPKLLRDYFSFKIGFEQLGSPLEMNRTEAKSRFQPRTD